MNSILTFTLLSLQLAATHPPATPRVVLFGDSQFVGPPGTGFLRTLEAEVGAEVEFGLLARCGFRPSHWFHGRRAPVCPGQRKRAPAHWGVPPLTSGVSIPDVHRTARPDLYVFALGGNLSKSSAADIEMDLEPTLRFLERVRTPCIWISPLQVNKNRAQRARASARIKDVVKTTCEVIDGEALSFYPVTIYGLHYTGPRTYRVQRHDPLWVRELAGRDRRVSLSELGVQSGHNIGAETARWIRDLLNLDE